MYTDGDADELELELVELELLDLMVFAVGLALPAATDEDEDVVDVFAGEVAAAAAWVAATLVVGTNVDALGR